MYHREIQSIEFTSKNLISAPTFLTLRVAPDATASHSGSMSTILVMVVVLPDGTDAKCSTQVPMALVSDGNVVPAQAKHIAFSP